MLEIRFLGQFDLRKSSHSVQIHSHPAQLLLAYLAMRPGVQHRREKVAGLLWPDMPEQNARRNLRHALWQVRKAIGDEYIQADRLALGLDTNASCWIDVVALKEGGETTSLNDLAVAVSQYHGELLPGFYEDWIVAEREALRGVFERCMGRLLEGLEADARWEDVLRWAERWIAQKGSLEPAFRSMMQAYDGLGNKAGIATSYRRLVETLQDELGVAPSEETQSLYRQLSLEGPTREPGPPKTVRGETPVRSAVHQTSKFALLRRLTGSRLIGRDYELAELLDFWKRAQGGQGHLLLIAGEAGIGKTRLVRELAREVEQRGGAVLQGHYYDKMDVPYLGFWEAMRDHIRSIAPHQAREAIGPLAPELIKLIPEIAELVGSVETSPRLGTVAAERIRLFDHVSRFIVRLATRAPLLFFLDDLHWMDDASTALLSYILRQTRNAPVLFVGTMRDKEVGLEHPLHRTLLDLNRERLYTRLRLLPLPDKQVNRLLTTLLAGPVDTGLADIITRHTGGIPLFVEEVVKSLLENDTIRLEAGRWRQEGEAGIGVPHTVEMMINVRAAGLGADCQAALQKAAVLGQGFETAVLRHMLGWPEKRLLDTLDEALQSGVLTDGTSPDRYRFNHALVQQTLYERFSAWERADAHLSAGEALEAVYAGRLDEQVELLAHHFAQAHAEGVIKAADYLLHAAEKAAAIYAHDQAIAYLRQGLDLLTCYPKLPEAAQNELRLLLALGAFLGHVIGADDDEIGRIFSRADNLCRQIRASIDDQFTAVRGLFHHYLTLEDNEKLSALADRLMSLANQSEDSGLYLEVYHSLWGREARSGNTRQAQEYIEQGRKLYNFEAHQHHAHRFGHDPGICCLRIGAANLWCQGYPDQALIWGQEAFQLGQKMVIVNDRLVSLETYTTICELRGDQQKTAEWHRKEIALVQETKYSVPTFRRLSLQGLILAWQGLYEQAFTHAQEAIEIMLTMQGYASLSFMRFLQVCLLTDHIAEGLQFMKEQLTRHKMTGERLFQSEIRRLYGELLLRQDSDSTANAAAQFQLALDIARKQEAKSLELRAAMSLARLWQAQGNVEPARQLLQPIYDWFTEGFDTADLIEARRLLGLD